MLTSCIWEGLGEVPLMKGTSVCEEGTLGPGEGKKRQRELSKEPSESKKIKVEETKADQVALTPEAAGCPRDEGEGKIISR